jgi:hypothetical protein
MGKVLRILAQFSVRRAKPLLNLKAERMKNKIILAAALFLTIAAGAQTTPDSTHQNPQTNQTATATTVLSDTSINAAYIADPEALKALTTETLRPEHAFPVLGSYTATGSSSGNVTVSLDSANKGIVWVEGLPQGKFKALMKKAPSTYKVPAQTTESGKSVAEGTLFLNPASKELTILLGRSFDDADPTSFLTSNTKQKTKAWQYTGVKAGAATTTSPAAKY